MIVLDTILQGEQYWENLKRRYPFASFLTAEASASNDAAVLVSRIEPIDIEAFPKLQWVQYIGTGVDGILDDPIMESDIILTNASGVAAVPMAEFVLTTMLSMSRDFGTLRKLQRRKSWEGMFGGEELGEKVVGILGYGSIGREVARLCAALGMKVLATKRRPLATFDGGYAPRGCGDKWAEIPDHIYGSDELAEMVEQVDFLVIAVPLTEETRGIVGWEELELLPDGYLVNVGRGQVVDESALLRVLESGHLRGAALDVFADEPLREDSPFWKMENVLVSPHISCHTPLYWNRFTELLGENMERFLSRKQLLNQIDKRAGY